MARHSIQSAPVQALIQSFLLPLYLERGSVTATTKALKDALATMGEQRQIHVNRIQALLSADVTRGVNDLTLDLVTQAAEVLASQGWAANPYAVADQLKGLADQATPLLVQDGSTLEEAARSLSVPLAVLKAALAQSGSTVTPTPTSLAPAVAALAPAAPDWSYQDVAVTRCLDAFRRRPKGNIGLVLPTGAGKTRTALRIILEVLARASSETSRVLWVTHRHTLRTQAFRELNKLLANDPVSLPLDAMRLAKRISFIMVGEVEDALEQDEAPALVVVDEAHHAAAKSYQPIFDAIETFPVLLLTATPNRPDRLPIGIDEIAFTITYRELAERHAILRPKFEPFPVESFEWVDRDVAELADFMVNETADRFNKPLVLVNRVDQLVRFHDAFLDRLAREPDHPLQPEDIGFIHGGGNSHGLPNEDFIELFAGKPMAVLISAQMLLEGFDDPAIDAVVITYETTSVIKLMQAAGRCVRYAPGKRNAFVIQADNPDLAYRFDQRWLYQEIEDYLRPELLDEEVSSVADLHARIESLMSARNVPEPHKARVRRALARLAPGETPRLMFYGMPYFEAPDRFAEDAVWGVFCETSENSAVFRQVFNGFSLSGARQSDTTEYLNVVAPGLGLVRDGKAGSLWRQMVEVLTSAHWAGEALRGDTGGVQSGRPRGRYATSSWLTYVVFHIRHTVPPELEAFLADCHNRSSVAEAYLQSPGDIAGVLKTELPLGGAEAVLLNAGGLGAVTDWLTEVRHALRAHDPTTQLVGYAEAVMARAWPSLPFTHASRLERLLSDTGRQRLLLTLIDPRKDLP